MNSIMGFLIFLSISAPCFYAAFAASIHRIYGNNITAIILFGALICATIIIPMVLPLYVAIAPLLGILFVLFNWND